MPTPTTSFTRHRGMSIAYTVDGPPDGAAIVLQHGWTSQKEAWRGYVDAFVARGYRCICIDSLGHGESDKPADPTLYAREQRAGDVVAVMDSLNIERAHFIGYSMGGWIACCMAEFHPARLKSLMIGGHCPGTGSTEETGGAVSDGILSFDQILKMHDFGFDAEEVPAMRHSFDVLEDVEGHDVAVAEAGVPVLLWKGRGEPVICDKGAALAARQGWSFFSVDGDHVEATLNYEANLEPLIAFLTSADIGTAD